MNYLVQFLLSVTSSLLGSNIVLEVLFSNIHSLVTYVSFSVKKQVYTHRLQQKGTNYNFTENQKILNWMIAIFPEFYLLLIYS
jgi:hypothetical protein